MAKANIRANTNAATGGRPAGTNNVVPRPPMMDPEAESRDVWAPLPPVVDSRTGRPYQEGTPPRKGTSTRQAIENARNPRNWQERPVGQAFEGARNAYQRDQDFKLASIREAIARAIQGPAEYDWLPAAQESWTRAAAFRQGLEATDDPRLAATGSLIAMPTRGPDTDEFGDALMAGRNTREFDRLAALRAGIPAPIVDSSNEFLFRRPTSGYIRRPRQGATPSYGFDGGTDDQNDPGAWRGDIPF